MCYAGVESREKQGTTSRELMSSLLSERDQAAILYTGGRDAATFFQTRRSHSLLFSAPGGLVGVGANWRQAPRPESTPRYAKDTDRAASPGP